VVAVDPVAVDQEAVDQEVVALEEVLDGVRASMVLNTWDIGTYTGSFYR
jgi:hypothetical protein